MLSEFLSAILPSARNDEKEEEPPKGEQADAPAEEEEAPEPEDVHPVVRQECQESAECSKVAHHYQHCQDKVNAGEGAKGENCIEELFQYVTFSSELVSTCSNRSGTSA
ncbi:hypothetical protein BKA62DRAFT_618593 [Auriculariales sp. MPI-PUGE-AT-0066]|nr:hypothetical protein BKA62DRAFT_618593 [Auriculariales sp. MPI-PUGE-AT-0066]